MNILVQAVRQLARAPWFTGVALLTLALGIGANTAMFTVLNTVMFKPLPFPDSERLVRIYRTSPQSQTWPHSVPDHMDLREQSRSFAALSLFTWWGYNLAEPGEPAELLEGIAASANIFETLGVKPFLGRLFAPGEDQAGNDAVVVLGYAFWQQRFGADPTIIGRQLRIDGKPVEVIGVLSREAECPVLWGMVDVWRPLAFTETQRNNRHSHWLQCVGRLKPGVSVHDANAEAARIGDRLARTYPESNAREGLRLMTLRQSSQDATGRRVSLMTMGLSVFVLLIACTNLANLLLVRGLGRMRDSAIRAALGANRFRIAAGFMAESAVLALAGGGLGLGLGIVLSRLIGERILIGGEPGLAIPVDLRVLLFALGLSATTALVFGSVPAWLLSRVRAGDALNQRGVSVTPGFVLRYFRPILIVGQITLALVLLGGAAAFGRGLHEFAGADPGWRVDQLVKGHLSLPAERFASDQERLQFLERAELSLASIPGVEHVAMAWSLPVWAFDSSRNFFPEDRPRPAQGEAPLAYVVGVTPGYFATMGIPLRSGRGFSRADTTNAPRVVVINESMARAFWPGTSPLGKRIGAQGAHSTEWSEVVGVVPDTKAAANFGRSDTSYQMYVPMAQEMRGFAVAILRATAAPGDLVHPARRAIAAVDPDQAFHAVEPVRTTVDGILGNFVLTGWCLAGFALLGLTLALLGIHGVVAGLVAQRRSEIGVRIALGARPGDVLRVVLGRAMAMAGIGVGLGFGGAVAVCRLLGAAAPGLPVEPGITLGIATLGLLAAVVVACAPPARQALKVDPAEVLRHE